MFNEDWTILKTTGADNIIHWVEWTLFLTLVADPDVLPYEVNGRTELERMINPIDARNASKQRIIDQVKVSLGHQLISMKEFAYERMMEAKKMKDNDVYLIAGGVDEPSSFLINIERDRRIADGFTFQGNTYDFDTASKQRITGGATLAGFAIGQGAGPGNYYWHGGATPFTWITKENTVVQLDAIQMFQIGQAAANWETYNIFKSRALKDMSPIPLDYTDDKYWV